MAVLTCASSLRVKSNCQAPSGLQGLKIFNIPTCKQVSEDITVSTVCIHTVVIKLVIKHKEIMSIAYLFLPEHKHVLQLIIT